jgi:aminopeptidase N
MEVIKKSFQFFESYFDIKEVVKKSGNFLKFDDFELFNLTPILIKDHFATPDFSGGAMENWGLVLYRESAILFDNEKSLLEDEFFVTLVISHEIAHSVNVFL